MEKRAYRHWTLQEIEYMRQAWRAKTAQQIAHDLDSTTERIEWVLKRYKISGSKGKGLPKEFQMHFDAIRGEMELSTK
jgi:hypothetical protein